ncbi:amidohydrolase [Luteimonas dalianensis]|uniref:amidohydrolase n=1 Tax=Luteimonas dalianensis TaxID=1148196 RepID=UPI003BF20E0F
MRRLLPLLIAGLLAQGCAQNGDASTDAAGADGVRLLVAERIHTSDPSRPQAGAMAWDADGRIVEVGSAEDLRSNWPGAEVVDLGDAVVVPGLIDSHGHLMSYGFSLMSADLAGALDKAEVISRLQAFAADLPEGAWLQGRGWDQNLWPEREFPTAADLDEAFPDRPVWLVRVDGHAGWGNSEALRRAEAVEGARPLAGDWHPEGARIERVDGQASGVFVGGRARALVERAIPEQDEALREQALERALAAAVSMGLTGVHDMGVSRADLALFRRFADEGRLPLRVAAYAAGDGDAFADLCSNGLYTHDGGRLWMHGIKLFADGALGSRGAALKEEYSDDPGNHGLLAYEPAAYEDIVRRAHECGVQVTTHAIGDRGNRAVLDAYANVLGDSAGPGHRWRIEHAQIVSVEDIPRFFALDVIASMQPTHATSDMGWAGDRVGQERLVGAYAWRSMMDAGVRLALGSDFPVESADPRLGLYAAVTRQDRDGQPPGGWLPEQRMTAAEALEGFTAGSAYATRSEGEIGRLAPGLRADFVVLGEDPLQVPAAQLDALTVRATWVDGEAVYEVR